MNERVAPLSVCQAIVKLHLPFGVKTVLTFLLREGLGFTR